MIVPKKQTMKAISIRMPLTLFKELKKAADQERRTLTGEILVRLEKRRRLNE